MQILFFIRTFQKKKSKFIKIKRAEKEEAQGEKNILPKRLPNLILVCSLIVMLSGIIIMYAAWIGIIFSIRDSLIIEFMISTLFGFILQVFMDTTGMFRGLIVMMFGLGFFVVTFIIKNSKSKKGKNIGLGMISWRHPTATKQIYHLNAVLGIVFTVIFSLAGLFQRYVELWFKYPGILSSVMYTINESDFSTRLYMLFYNFHVCASVSGIVVPFWQTFFLIDMNKGPPFIFLSQDPVINWGRFGVGIVFGMIYLLFLKFYFSNK